MLATFDTKSRGTKPQLTNSNNFCFGNDTLRPEDSEYNVIFWIQVVVVELLAAIQNECVLVRSARRKRCYAVLYGEWPTWWVANLVGS